MHVYEHVAPGSLSWTRTLVNYTVSESDARDLCVADFDSDGNDDLAILTGTEITVMSLNPGSSTYKFTTTPLISLFPDLDPGMLNDSTTTTAAAFDPETGKMHVGVGNIIRVATYNATSGMFEPSFSNAGNHVLSGDIVSLHVGTLGPGDDNHLFFACTTMLGYYPSDDSSNPVLIDSNITTIKLMSRPTNLDADPDNEIAVGMESAHSGKSYLVCYDEVDGSWLARIVTDVDMLARFSSVDCGFVLPENPNTDLIVSSSSAGVMDYQQVNATWTGGSATFEPTIGTSGVQDGILTSTDLYPSSPLPDETHVLHEKYEIPPSQYDCNYTPGYLRANSTLVPYSIGAWDDYTVHSSQEDPYIDAEPYLGYAQASSMSGSALTAYRRQWIGSGANPVNPATGQPWDREQTSGSSLDEYLMNLPFASNSSWAGDLHLQDLDLSTGVVDPAFSSEYTNHFYTMKNYSVESPTYQGPEYSVGAHCSAGPKEFDPGVRHVVYPDAGVVNGILPYKIGSDQTQRIDEIPQLVYDNNKPETLESLFHVGTPSHMEVRVRFLFGLDERFDPADIDDDVTIKLHVRAVAYHEIEYAHFLSEYENYYLLPVRVRVGENDDIGYLNTMIYNGVTQTDIADPRNPYRLAWQESDSSADIPPEAYQFPYLFDQVETTFTLNRSGFLKMMSNGVILSARPIIHDPDRCSSAGLSNTYWDHHYIWKNNQIVEYSTPVIPIPLTDIKYKDVGIFVDSLWFEIEDSDQNPGSITHFTSGISINLSSDGIHQAPATSYINHLGISTVFNFPTEIRFGSEPVSQGSTNDVNGITITGARPDYPYYNNSDNLGLDMHTPYMSFYFSIGNITPELYNHVYDNWDGWKDYENSIAINIKKSLTANDINGIKFYFCNFSMVILDTQRFESDYLDDDGLLTFRFRVEEPVSYDVNLNNSRPSQFHGHCVIGLKQKVELAELHVIAGAKDEYWRLMNAIEHQIAFELDQSKLASLGVLDRDISDLRQIFIEVHALPKILQLNLPSFITSSFSQPAFDNSDLEDVRFKLKLEVWNWNTSSWMNSLFVDQFNRDLSEFRYKLPYFTCGDENAAVVAGSYFMPGLDYNLSDFLSHDDGFRFRITCTFIFETPESYDTLNLVGLDHATTKQTEFILLNSPIVSFKYYNGSQPIDITGPSTLDVFIGMPDTQQPVDLHHLLNVKCSTHVTISISLPCISFDSITNFMIEVSLYFARDDNNSHELVYMAPDPSNPLINLFQDGRLFISKADFINDSIDLGHITLPIPEYTGNYDDFKNNWAGVEKQFYVVACMHGPLRWNGWVPLPGNASILITPVDVGGIVEYYSQGVNQSNDGFLVKELEFPASAVSNTSSPEFLILHANLSVDLVHWSYELRDKWNLARHSLQDELGFVKFITLSLVSDKSTCQFYDSSNSRWLNSMLSINDSVFWDNLQVAPLNPVHGLAFMLVIGASNLTNMLTRNNTIKVRFILDLQDWIDSHPRFNGTNLYLKVLDARMVLYDDDGVASTNVIEASNQFTIDVEIPPYNGLEDLDAIKLNASAPVVVNLSTLNGSSIDAGDGVNVQFLGTKLQLSTRSSNKIITDRFDAFPVGTAATSLPYWDATMLDMYNNEIHGFDPQAIAIRMLGSEKWLCLADMYISRTVVAKRYLPSTIATTGTISLDFLASGVGLYQDTFITVSNGDGSREMGIYLYDPGDGSGKSFMVLNGSKLQAVVGGPDVVQAGLVHSLEFHYSPDGYHVMIDGVQYGEVFGFEYSNRSAGNSNEQHDAFTVLQLSTRNRGYCYYLYFKNVSFTSLAPDFESDPVELALPSHGGSCYITVSFKDFIKDLVMINPVDGVPRIHGRIVSSVEIMNNRLSPVNVHLEIQPEINNIIFHYSRWEAIQVSSQDDTKKVTILDLDGATTQQGSLPDVLLGSGMMAQNNRTASTYHVSILVHEFNNSSNVVAPLELRDIVVDHDRPHPRILVDPARLNDDGIPEFRFGVEPIYIEVLQPHVTGINVTFDKYIESQDKWIMLNLVQAKASCERTGSLFKITFHDPIHPFAGASKVVVHVTAFDVFNRTGNTTQIFIKDINPPTTALNVTRGLDISERFNTNAAYYIVRRGSEVSFTVSDACDGKIPKVHVRIIAMGIKSEDILLEGVEKNTEIPLDLEGWWDLGTDELWITAWSVDIAGNAEAGDASHTVVLYLDDARIITPVGKLALSGNIPMMHGDYFEATVQDSSGMPVANQRVDLYAGDWLLGSNLTTSTGYFCYRLEKVDVFTPDLYSAKFCKPNVHAGSWKTWHDVALPDQFGMLRNRDVVLLEKRFPPPVNAFRQTAIRVDLHRVFDATPDVPVAGGIQFDILIPCAHSSVYNSTTYENLKFRFIDDDNNTFELTQDSNWLIKTFDPCNELVDARTVMIDGIQLRMVRITISFAMISLLNIEKKFDPRKLATLIIDGRDSAIYPISVMPGEVPRQYLGLAGIRLVGQLGNHDGLSLKPGYNDTNNLSIFLHAPGTKWSHDGIQFVDPQLVEGYHETLEFNSMADNLQTASFTRVFTAEQPGGMFVPANGTATITDDGRMQLKSGHMEDTFISWDVGNHLLVFPDRFSFSMMVPSTDHRDLYGDYRYPHDNGRGELPSTLAYCGLADSAGIYIEIGLKRKYSYPYGPVLYAWVRDRGEFEIIADCWDDIGLVKGSLDGAWLNFDLRNLDLNLGTFDLYINEVHVRLLKVRGPACVDVAFTGLLSVIAGACRNGTSLEDAIVYFDNIRLQKLGTLCSNVCIKQKEARFEGMPQRKSSAFYFSDAPEDRGQWRAGNAKMGIDNGIHAGMKINGVLMVKTTYVY
ncbi:MAG: hypothetical protein ACXQS8_07595, partial [Candidatus Helarchaeales archaeon]